MIPKNCLIGLTKTRKNNESSTSYRALDGKFRYYFFACHMAAMLYRRETGWWQPKQGIFYTEDGV
jgi:hypothetical protein